MKKVSLLLTLIITLFSCSTENGTNETQTMNADSIRPKSYNFTATAAVDLSEDPTFVVFCQDFIDTYVEYAYLQQSQSGENQEHFLTLMSNPDLSFTEVEQIHYDHNIDFEAILDYQTMVSDLIYQVYLQYPEFDDMTEQDALGLILAELGEVIQNGKVIITSPYPNSPQNITADEIWYCVVESVGIGAASALTLKALKKEGVKLITKTLIKSLAKFAGPIGAAITVADFGFCLYRADQS